MMDIRLLKEIDKMNQNIKELTEVLKDIRDEIRDYKFKTLR